MNLLNVLIFIWGLLFGSFLNVIIYRIPRNLSIIFPGSFCPNCKNPIPLYRNIPLFSFLIQFGKCSNCCKKISYRYPFIELLTGIIWIFNFHFFEISTAFFSSLLSISIIAIVFIDYDYLIIPLKLIISSTILLIMQMIYNPGNVQESFLGIVIGVGYLGFVFLLTSAIMKKQTMGYGDLFLIAILGAWLGPMKILIVIFFSGLIGLTYWGINKLYYNKNNVKLPFGTFLGIAAIIISYVKIQFIYRLLNIFL